jgi:hypothetical protein
MLVFSESIPTAIPERRGESLLARCAVGLAEERSLVCTASSLNYLHRHESVLRPFFVVLLPLDLGPFGVVAGS